MRGISDDIRFKIKPRDLLKELSLNEQTIDLNFDDIPNSFYQELLEQLLERDYLNYTSDKVFIYDDTKPKKTIHWLQMTRLPIHPNEHEKYDLLSRWQGVLSSLHAWGYRFLFLLLRNGGQTKLFIGAASSKQGISAEEAIEQMREAAFGSMPGMGLNTLSKVETVDEIRVPLNKLNHIGAVTGIPSFRSDEQKGMLQTLDQLAFGIRDAYGTEKDYAMLVIADPIQDSDITDMISRYRRLGSEIHTGVKLMTGQSLNRGETSQEDAKLAAGVGIIGSIIGAIGGSFLGSTFLGEQVGKTIGTYLGASVGGQAGGMFGREHTVNVGGSASTNTEYLDKFAEYAETATDHHVKRLNEGRNLGFWNTGVYVLGTVPRDVVTVTGMLRSVYSGDETYFEPIRLHLFRPNSNAKEIVRDRFELLPMYEESLPTSGKIQQQTTIDHDNWHILGKSYQYLSTPINTKELSLATSLPRRDVPGLRFVKTAIRFANNPSPVKGDKITIGNIVDMGIIQNNTYDIDVDSLVRHTLVAGATGSGKSTTCKRILTEVMKRDIPVMVIEPAKDDYVRWAINMNKNLPEEKQFKIFMPGADDFDGTPIEKLCINPFEPAAFKGAKVDLLQHSEYFSVLLNACLPSEDVVPILMEEVVYETIREVAIERNIPFEDELVKQLHDYPTVDSMLIKAKEIMRTKTYADRNKDNLTEVLMTRFKTLKRGMRGRILNVYKSTDYNMLFSNNVIINLSRLAGTKDKSLIMSLLMQALYEYRQSCYAVDDNYRKLAQQNKLLHLMLVEEAHNVLLKPIGNQTSGNPQRAAADLFDSMLSDVRAYGQGLVVVDQVPTRLIEGATKNTNYKIVHRLSAPDDQEMMASCMAFRDDQKYMIPTLEQGHAIICGDRDDAAVWVKIPAPGQTVL